MREPQQEQRRPSVVAVWEGARTWSGGLGSGGSTGLRRCRVCGCLVAESAESEIEPGVAEVVGAAVVEVEVTGPRLQQPQLAVLVGEEAAWPADDASLEIPPKVSSLRRG